MILTDNNKIADKARHLTTTSKKPHPWLFDHDQIGYNYRMPSINAALGLSQMEKIEKKLIFKRDLAKRYQDWGNEKGYEFIVEPDNTVSNYWINLLLTKDIKERDSVLEYTNNNQVMTRPAWTPMHKLEMFQDCQKSDMSATEWFYERLVNVPSSSII